MKDKPNRSPEPSHRLPVPPRPFKFALGSFNRKRIDRLYCLLERADREGDTDMAATLRWAISTLENR